MKHYLLLPSLFLLIWSWAGVTPPPCPSLTMSGSNVSCFGSNNGSALVSVAGGSGNYSISWSNGINTSSNFGLGVGTYTVNVIDNISGCSVNGAYVVSAPSPISNSGIITNVNCFGNSTGGVNITPIGGTAPYTYQWTNALGTIISTSQDIINRSAGNYTVTITDNNGCSLNNTFQITQPNQAIGSSTVLNNVSCYGGSNGSIDLEVWGGTAPYTYLWTNGSNNQDISGLTVGNYSVTVTDNKGCILTSNSSIIQPSIVSSTINANPVSCFGFSNGTVSVSASGGTPPYQYSWQNNTTLFAQNTSTLSNIPSGNYTVTITDNNGCTINNSAVVNQPSQVLSSLTYTNVNCHGGNDGSINLSVSGGSVPYSYTWVNSTNQVIAISQDLLQIPADTFTVTISDVNGCTSNLSQIITEPQFPLSSTSAVTHVLCFGNASGQVSVVAAGGTLPYNYTWLSGQNTSVISNLIAGNYSFTITDQNGCTLSGNENVNQPIAPLSLTQSITNVTCFGFSNGAINTTVAGGTAPYTFHWANSVYLLAYQTEDLSLIPAENYIISILDQNGCSLTDTFAVTQPNALTNSITGVNILCHGDSTGSINLSVFGGTAPYSHNWSNGITAEDQTNVPSGNYQVTITDANGCIKLDSITLFQPLLPLTQTFTTLDVTCRDGSNGSIQLSVEGGTPGYTYNWSNASSNALNDSLSAGQFSVIVTDANGCTLYDSMTIYQPDALTLNEIITPVTCYGLSDGEIEMTTFGGTPPYQFTWFNSNFALSAQTEDLVNFPKDTYQVEILDSNGCFYEYFFDIPEPDSLYISVNQVMVTCHGGSDGSIDVTIFGGNPSYSYIWSNGATTEDVSNLNAGAYSLVVTDTKNCQDSAEIIIYEPEPVTSEITTTPVSCIDQKDGTALVQAFGGVGAYTYAWSNGITIELNESLSNQWYFVTVTDALGCTGIDSVLIPINPIACIAPVNCFTPNGDMMNDTWVIDNMELYPDLRITVYNRWGNLVYEQTGTYSPWDGSYNTNDLPAGTYYYIIELNYLDRAPVTGTINILK